MVKAWRERTENSAGPIECTIGDPRRRIQQGKSAIIQKLADNTMKHDGTSFLTIESCFIIYKAKAY